MTDVIQTVGAYAGLVALLAMGVLAFLVFSQARDIRRLRDWAGGAPERDAEVREVSEIVAEYQAGASVASISARRGLSDKTIYKALRHRNAVKQVGNRNSRRAS